jgi:hypothetical protein
MREFKKSYYFRKKIKSLFKSFTIISLSFVLAISILAPSMVSLVNEDYHEVVEDIHDDEKEDTEEKEIDTKENEKKTPLFLSVLNSFFHNSNATLISIFSIEGVSTYSLEIQLPPPEYSM